MNTSLRPIQILSAEKHWRAAFVDPDTRDIVERVVVAWALCAAPLENSQGECNIGLPNTIHGIVHLDGKMIPVGDCPNFVGYLEPGVPRDKLVRVRT